MYKTTIMNQIKQPLFIICATILISCGNQSETQNAGDSKDSTGKTGQADLSKDPRQIGGVKSQSQVAIDDAQKLIAESKDKMIGYWVGSFGNNMINLTLSEVKGNEISGFSVCAGNYRPIKGSITQSENGGSKIVMEEPGDDKYDGRFEFEIDKKMKKLSGKWIPFKAKGNTEKTYALAKKNFEYNPTVGEYPQASERELSEGDVENYTAEELEIMRNEIYARHGYSFKNKKMRAHFEKQKWYVPMGVDIRSQLSDVEAKNIELIYRYEEYYKVHYDEYGR